MTSSRMFQRGHNACFNHVTLPHVYLGMLSLANMRIAIIFATCTALHTFMKLRNNAFYVLSSTFILLQMHLGFFSFLCSEFIFMSKNVVLNIEPLLYVH